MKETEKEWKNERVNVGHNANNTRGTRGRRRGGTNERMKGRETECNENKIGKNIENQKQIRRGRRSGRSRRKMGKEREMDMNKEKKDGQRIIR